jgi:ABC-2 type transport system ATP-binding protein
MISCRDLTRRFGDFTAVDGLTMDVPCGSICAFLGANGAGKSTTVKMLTGLLRPTSGSATVCGLDVSRDAAALKRRIGVLPESLGLFDDLSVEEHLDLTAEVYGLPKTEAGARIEQLLRALGLRDGRATFARDCSHGMRKKTSLAMALLPNPDVLFLDEPFEAIDPVTSKVMHEILVKAAQRGVTVFLTSHILSTVERIADQFVMIRKGRVVLNAFAEDLPRSIEELYFELAEPPLEEDLAWLGHARS